MHENGINFKIHGNATYLMRRLAFSIKPMTIYTDLSVHTQGRLICKITGTVQYSMIHNLSKYFNPICFMIKYAKVFICVLYVVLYIISLLVTILRAFLTSTFYHATLEKSYQSRAQHLMCSPCHQISHLLIPTCTQTNKL